MGYNQQLDKAWEKTVKMEPFETDSSHPPRFRLSDSPFCQYRFLFQWYDFVKSKEADFWDYSSDFFTDIGTAIHSILQKWIPINNPGMYLGSWKCPSCRTIIENATGPKFCKKCKRWMTYEEFSFVEKPGFTGHCDGILLLNNNLIKDFGVTIHNTEVIDKYIRKCKNPVDAVVLEYKSAGSYKAKKITNPTPKNKAQAMMYAPCAQRKMDSLGLNVNIIGVVLKYLSRDNPSSASNDFFVPKDNKWFKFTRNIVLSVKKAVKTGDVDYITEIGIPCISKYKNLYEECGYKESCKQLRKEIDLFLKDTRKAIRKDFEFLDSIDENKR